MTIKSIFGKSISIDKSSCGIDYIMTVSNVRSNTKRFTFMTRNELVRLRDLINIILS